jgi:hypothetical protein
MITRAEAGAGVLFSMWVTFAAGYQSVHQALMLVLAGVVLYAFLKARRETSARSPLRRTASLSWSRPPAGRHDNHTGD